MAVGRCIALGLAALCAGMSPPHVQAASAKFTMAQALAYPFVSDLTAAERADRIAWVRNLAGARNVWVADGPAYTPRQVTRFSDDDGQEITQLTFSPDGQHLLYARGGDHDANWPAEGNLAPDPSSSPTQPVVTIWAAPLRGGAPVKIAEGDAPALSARSVLAYIKDDQVWTAALSGKGKPERLFFDRGKDGSLQWSPDGSRLAFVSRRDDHAFIGIYSAKDKPILWLAPSTSLDGMPRWSPDGGSVAFVRAPGNGGAPRPILKQTPQPWSIWTASTTTGAGHRVWQSPETLPGSYPDTEGEANLHWMAGDRLVFLAFLDNWEHLYSVPVAGGVPLLLTPGHFMVEYAVPSRDRRFVIYNANAGAAPGDGDRRHLFRVPVDKATPQALTAGDTIEWQPAAGSDKVAFITAGVQQPPSVGVVDTMGRRTPLDTGPLPPDFPLTDFLTPKSVTFKASDGVVAHGQVFQRPGAASQPGIIFVHGGPPRQMLLGWHYMDYYSNAYAVNQYLANHGFTVLSVNYRLGIGYGRPFHQPDHAGPTGAAEYRDVLAGARFLQSVGGVDPKRIGMWGGSYGGYLTALALARDSDTFKAGVDLHGVHDWSRFVDVWFGKAGPARYEKGDREQAMKVAWDSSPESAMDRWRSPVLLIQGDDDRNVQFQQTVDLARRLEVRHLPFDEIVLPDEIHGFLRHASWLRVDTATADYLTKKLGAHP
jgi:dipeptidyl aminopeptidase/acylaminoacyl peptidase